MICSDHDVPADLSVVDVGVSVGDFFFLDESHHPGNMINANQIASQGSPGRF